MITVHVYKCGNEIVVAAADKDLIGKTFREGLYKLDVDREFFEGEDGDEDMLLNRLSMCTVANLVGKETVGVAIKHSYINSECVLTIAGIPHAQLAKM